MEIDLSLIRKILFQTTPGAASDQRISQNALEAVGELMRQFITETHRRASVEVCSMYMHRQHLTASIIFYYSYASYITHAWLIFTITGKMNK